MRRGCGNTVPTRGSWAVSKIIRLSFSPAWKSVVAPCLEVAFTPAGPLLRDLLCGFSRHVAKVWPLHTPGAAAATYRLLVMPGRARSSQFGGHPLSGLVARTAL